MSMETLFRLWYKRGTEFRKWHQFLAIISHSNNQQQQPQPSLKPTMKFFLVLALATVALARRHERDSEPEPQYQPRPSYKPAPAYKPRYQPEPYDNHAEYSYGYQVKDDYAGLDFNANEARDGYATNGGYSVLLPDGRVQTVTYRVDDATSGFIADVTYSGEARYDPAPAPSYKPKPAYKPRPEYKPAPTYEPAPSYERPSYSRRF